MEIYRIHPLREIPGYTEVEAAANQTAALTTPSVSETSERWGRRDGGGNGRQWILIGWVMTSAP